MEVSVRHAAAYGIARLALGPGEVARVAPGTVAATSWGTAVELRAPGALARVLGTDPFRTGTVTGPPTGGWADVAPGLPGDLHVVELDGAVGWTVARGSWLAAGAGVVLRADDGGPGGRVRASGAGPLLLACYGALDPLVLADGEFATVDAAHVVAHPDDVRTRSRAVDVGAWQPAGTGDGLLLDVAGPGTVLTQTRTPHGLASWLAAHLPGAAG